jgi:hypothetical protein
MARRITKSNKTATISVFPELPGAVFYGDIFDEDIDYASRLQAIRDDYESTDCQATLWHELSQMGFGSREISEFLSNPAAITSCGYGLPYCGTSLPSALVAV